jgi:hypothetical protein
MPVDTRINRVRVRVRLGGRGDRGDRGSVVVPISIYKNTAAHDRRATRKTYRGVFTGLKHQCVELARRWCVRAYGVTFREVDTAADMMRLRSGTCTACGRRPIRIAATVVKADTVTTAEPGDLLIWKAGRPGPYRATGHVAVVVDAGDAGAGAGATAGNLIVAEQNGATRSGLRRVSLSDARTRRALAGRLRISRGHRCYW